MRLRERRLLPADISIAPLVDCVFLLLVFFLVTSSFDRRQALPVQVPAARTAVAVPASDTVVLVTVDAAGAVSVCGRPTPVSSLARRLAVEARRGPRPVLLRADEAAALRTIVAVIDGARSAGLPEVTIAVRAVTTEAD